MVWQTRYCAFQIGRIYNNISKKKLGKFLKDMLGMPWTCEGKILSWELVDRRLNGSFCSHRVTPKVVIHVCLSIKFKSFKRDKSSEMQSHFQGNCSLQI